MGEEEDEGKQGTPRLYGGNTGTEKEGGASQGCVMDHAYIVMHQNGLVPEHGKETTEELGPSNNSHHQ